MYSDHVIQYSKNVKNRYAIQKRGGYDTFLCPLIFHRLTLVYAVCGFNPNDKVSKLVFYFLTFNRCSEPRALLLY